MTRSSPGRFWALGVGPGDPELLTLKALRVVRQVAVVYHVGPEPRRGRAYEIVAPHLRPEQETRIVLTESMTSASSGDWRQVYRPAVEQIVADCRQGKDVAFITEGDPTLYSTAAYVWQLLAELHPDIAIEVVPGVSSITAAAARAKVSLAQKDETVAVVPAHYHAAAAGSWIDDCSTVVFLKPAAGVAQIAAAAGLDHEAIYVENLGRPGEWLTSDLACAAERSCYFSLVIVCKRGDRHAGLLPALTRRVGTITVVGLGPGAFDLLTPRALQALRGADVIVGYESYLQSLAPLNLRAELRGSPIGAETARARLAVELAQQGRLVALVSSGDAGIYGMASLLLETAGEAGIAVEIVPGVTAATAAAALLGAPLGHDFACVSLSDLLTPWELIAARLDAAARSDFVIALYNPVSQKRTWQLPQARDIVLWHRRPDTPVGVVDRASRTGELKRLTTLGELASAGIGMETVVLIGNSQTRVVNGRLVTPRGYPASRECKRPVEQHTSGAPQQRSDPNPILTESFAIIERELGGHELPPWAFAVVRRMIHASADFDFARTLRFGLGLEDAICAVIRSGVTIVTDTEMVLEGIRTACASWPGLPLVCHLNDRETQRLAAETGLTRSAAGIRVAARQHPRPILAIGNAPTALDEALRSIEHEGWRPAALIGMPVGFVGVEEAKRRLLAQTAVPYLTCSGRKGGSAVTAAAVNALIEWCKNP